MKEELVQNKMGVVPVPRLLLGMGLPMIVSMLLQALYNIVDSYFVSNMTGVGDAAVNALTLAFPIQVLMIGIGVGTGVGVNALLSRSLGMGGREEASQIAGNAIFLGICTYAAFLIFGLVGVEPYIRSQTSNPQIIGMACDYLGICCNFSFGAILYMIYEKLLQGTGRTGLATVGQVAGAVTNIVLDPILIFGLLGLPALGIRGAAWATVIGQVVSLALDVVFHHCLNRDVDGGLRYLRPRRALIAAIYRVGVPAIVMQALMSVMTYGVNLVFVRVSTPVVTAYGLYYKIQQFIFFAAFAMNNTILPVVAFNYGKRDGRRLRDGINYGILYTVIIMAIGLVGLQLLAGPLLGLFDVSPEVKALCVRAVRIVSLGYLFVGANLAFQGIFQALGSGVVSLVISLVRLILVPLPLALLLTGLPQAEHLIWIAFPVGEAAGLLVSLLFMATRGRRCLAQVPADPAQPS